MTERATSFGRLLGYMANRSDRLAEALEQEQAVAAIPASPEPAGYGLGFYQGGEVLHKKRPLFENTELDWRQVAKDVRTDAAVFHLRQGETVGAFRIDNTHPFRMRSWLFAHNGTLDKFDALREPMLASLPDFIRRNLRGQTDSEHLFHVLLARLHAHGQIENPEAGDAQVLPALRETVELVERLSAEVGAGAPPLNLILTNGRRMFGLRSGHPMYVVERESGGSAAGPTRFRYVMLVSGVPLAPHGYREVPNRSVLSVDRNLRVATHGL